MNSARPPTASNKPSAPIELRLDRPANGGTSVGRDGDGRAVFCEGGLPGEMVRVDVHTAKKRFARGRVIEVLDAAPGRVEPACESHGRGCGGCDYAHAELSLQRIMKRHVVSDALTRIGRLDPERVNTLLDASAGAETIPQFGYRTTVRMAIDEQRAGYRKRSSRKVVAPSMCGVAHAAIEEIILSGVFPESAGTEVVLRVSEATGERMAVLDGAASGVMLPSDVVIVTRDQLSAGRKVFLTEHAAGRDWQVSAESFFQAGPSVATALVNAVSRAAGAVDGDVVVDAYAGIGLFGGTVAASASSLVSVEQSGSSTNDARVNLRSIDAHIAECRVEDWAATPADVVIADPARAGLGEKGVEALDACGASRFVLVSCDTGSLGRDVGLLAGRGYTLDSVQVVDAFPDTSHVETVVGLRR